MSKKFILVMSALFIVVAAGVFAAQMYIGAKVMSAVDERIVEIKERSGIDVTYGDIDVGFLGSPVRVNDVIMQDEQGTQIRMQAISTSEFDPRDYRKGGDLAIDGFVIEKINLLVVDLLLDGFNPANRPLNFSLSYDYDQKDMRLDIRELALDVAGYCKFSCRARLHEVFLPENGSAMESAQFKTAKVGMLNMELKNDKAMDEAYAFFAAKEGISPEVYQRRVVSIARLQLAEAERKNNPFDAELLRAAVAFLEQPKSIALRVDPPKPVSLIEIGRLTPSEAYAQMGLHCEVNSI